MTPEKAVETMFGWLPVIMVGGFVIGYVINMIKDLWRNWRD